MNPVMTIEQARELERQLTDRLRAMGLIELRGHGVASKYAEVSIGVDYPHQRGRTAARHERDYGVVVTTGLYRNSTPPRKKKIHRELDTAIAQIVKEVNAIAPEKLNKRGEREMDAAQKDFDRGWCAHRRGITCKLVNGVFHVLVKVGSDEVWQNDVEYAPSHDTLVFRSEIGKIDRWITIEALQKLLDRGVLLNPADVQF